ncbi:LysR family transcriptional regulator [Avibacterium avium]|uniref:LysR family transcriptional regulator n=1 Tax=Avibacterium avium TaxID=751 RepID=UPI003BF7F832
MKNRLELLHIFCTVANTLHFKNAARELGVSPQRVTRSISELEQSLGEVLFQRSTRQVQLTDFARQFLPRAQRLIDDAQALLQPHQSHELSGTVSIALPDYPILMNEVLQQLLIRLSDFPDIQLHWRTDNALIDVVAGKIDVGIRFGNPQDSRLIVKKVGQEQDIIVASPNLLQHYGEPKNWQDLIIRYPLSALINPNNGRIWQWEIGAHRHQPNPPKLLTNNISSELSAVLAGQTVAHIPRQLCQPYLERGELVELFPHLPRKQWPCYLYRPKRQAEPPRVKRVFDLLAEILQGRFG